MNKYCTKNRPVFITMLVVLLFVLSGCKQKDDIVFAFPESVTCNESVTDYVEVETETTFEELDQGYLYSYVYDYGQFIYVFYNPDAEYSSDEYITTGAYGNKFFNDDGAFLVTEIPEGYYLDSVTYKYTSMCEDSEDESLIARNIAKSFLYFSETEYTESEFLNQHPELFE